MILAAIYIPKGELSHVFGDKHLGYTLNLGGKYLYELVSNGIKTDIKEKVINPNYIVGFWGNYIQSVSTIIGKNGTGKSSILDLFRDNSSCEYVVEDANGENAEIRPSTIDIFDIIFYSPFLNINDINFENDNFYNVSKYGIMLDDTKHENLDLQNLLELHKSENIKRWIKFRNWPNISEHLNKIKLPIFNKIRVKINNIDVDDHNTPRAFIPFFKAFKILYDQEKLNTYIEQEKKQGTPIGSYNKKYFNNKNELELYIINGVINKVHNIFERSSNKYLEEGYIEANLDTKSDVFVKIKTLKESFYWFLDNAYVQLNKRSEKISLPKKEIKELIELLIEELPNDHDIENCSQYEIDLDKALKVIEANENFIKSFSHHFTYDSKIFLVFKPDVNLSSGEKGMYDLFASICDIQHKFKNNIPDDTFLFFKRLFSNSDKIILLDEPEMGFHPEWKKNFINTILEIFPVIFEEKQLQILFTTHDPLTLSDIPNTNITYLSKKVTGETEIFKDNRNIKTFGANIHSLLADSFFLEDGFMGNFAKEKINDLIKYLTFDESIEESEVNEKAKLNWTSESAEKFIGIIGEPLLEYDLKELYLSKFYDEQKIDDEIRKLQELKNRLGK